jgi:hypothetical protein
MPNPNCKPQMIGSGKDPAAVQRHLRKMFAGIQSLDVDADGGKLTAMRSKEGEVVEFADAVAFSRETEVNVWLCKAEEAMRTALAWWMGESVEAGGWLVAAGLRLEGDSGSRNSLLAWMDASPAQVVLLALQVHMYQCAASHKLAPMPCLPTLCHPPCASSPHRPDGVGRKCLMLNAARTRTRGQVLACQKVESDMAESGKAGGGGAGLESSARFCGTLLGMLADSVLEDMGAIRRCKVEHLIGELVHLEHVVAGLVSKQVSAPLVRVYACEGARWRVSHAAGMRWRAPSSPRLAAPSAASCN